MLLAEEKNPTILDYNPLAIPPDWELTKKHKVNI